LLPGGSGKDRHASNRNGGLRPAAGVEPRLERGVLALHSIGGALAEIIALDLAILTTTILFFRRDRSPACCSCPIWLDRVRHRTHACLWRLNP